MISDKHEPKTAFAALWHAEIFALTVHLHEAGHFCWSEWANALGKNFAAVKNSKASNEMAQGLDGSDDYYQIWLQTLIEVIQEKGIVDLEMLEVIKAQWADAYIQTPHGHPVTL